MKNLENLTIHRFRGLQDLHLESLGQINLLVGVNNSGKTSVLEAISTYCNPADPLVWLSTAWRRNIKLSLEQRLEFIKWMFPKKTEEKLANSHPMETYISGNGRFQVRESRAIYREIEGTNISSNRVEDNMQDYKAMNYIIRGAEIDLKVRIEEQNGIKDGSLNFKIWEKQQFINPGKRSDVYLPVETVTPFSHAFEQLQVKLLSEATFEGFKPEVIKLIQVIDPGIIDLEILSLGGEDTNIYIIHKSTGVSPLSAFGDGVRRLLFIALTVAKVRGGVLLIDELETAIHTEALKPTFSWLVQWCQQMDVQLFATTHSLETIDELLDASESADFAFYRLYPPDSKIKVIRHDRERLKRLRQELGKEVRW